MLARVNISEPVWILSVVRIAIVRRFWKSGGVETTEISLSVVAKKGLTEQYWLE